MATISQQGQQVTTDVLVIGSGIAGLSTVLALSQQQPHCKITLISKGKLGESNSRWAQGGIAAASQHEEDIKSHVDDTLKASDGLADPDIVNDMLHLGADAIKFLVKNGVRFDANLAQEGGHSIRRIYHAGDHTGQEIIQALLAAIKTCENVTLSEHHAAVNLITQTKPHQPGDLGEVIGAYVLNEQTGLIDTVTSQCTVLATGGAGKIYRYTSNPDTATGDGIAMAYRAGARVGNMEFYQFHPTLLYHKDLNTFLMTEALRGEGAYLVHPENGERFMKKYSPAAMELATRDIVARAIFSEIEQCQHNFMYLDVRHLDAVFLQERFPLIDKMLKKIGINMTTDLIPIVPAAHYLCGGIMSDMQGRTDLKRLYAVGETAFSGLHGANRLASNSLLEGVIMARLAAKDIAETLHEPLALTNPPAVWDSESVQDLRRATQINAHWRGLRSEMNAYAGIVRTQAGLEDFLRLIRARQAMVDAYYWKHTVTRDLIELRNIIQVAELITKAALKRCESRGGHFREDFPLLIVESGISVERRQIT